MKYVKRGLLLLLAVMIIVSTVVILNGHKLYKSAIEEMSLKDKIEKIQSDENYTKKEDVPDDYKNAIIAVEDHRFKEHGAIDVISIGRAIVSNIRAGELNEGGSTITQQVAKNLYFITEDDFISRKIAEIFMAMELEKNYSKEDILELYMNTIYFGEGYYGIKEAANGYYKKEPKDLTLYESTMLAGVPNAPSVYAPTINPDLARSRQGKVIRSMVKYGYLSQEEADKIIQ
ncbi:MAG: transglycosylase domain-containing protein [Clostridia bacterium]